MLDYKLLEAMAAVVLEGGFDKAARVLHLTQSAVSQRVKLLEEQTGQILLVRSSPPAATPAGRRFLKHFLQVAQLEKDLAGEPAAGRDAAFASLTVGINADSLATWFPAVIAPFLSREQVVLDLRTDDQDRTHRMLRDGEVIGCISSRDRAIQGCRIRFLGSMVYRLVAGAAFADRYFPRGVTAEALGRAPAVVFNRRDELLTRLLNQVMGAIPADLPIHYLPSSERFADFITAGHAYGMLPDQQCESLLTEGRLVDLAPANRVRVDLFWHCWNLRSKLLDRLTRCLVAGANRILPAETESERQ